MEHPILGFLKDLFELIAGIKCFPGPNASNFMDRQWIFTNLGFVSWSYITHIGQNTTANW